MTTSEEYRRAMKMCGGCPIEAGFMGRLADHECRHGRLAGDKSRPCGCWPGEARRLRLATALVVVHTVQAAA